MSALSFLNGKTKPWQRSRFDRRPEELARDSEKAKARKVALIQQLAKRTLSKSEDKNGQPS
jgi:hypothetical protein